MSEEINKYDVIGEIDNNLFKRRLDNLSDREEIIIYAILNAINKSSEASEWNEILTNWRDSMSEEWIETFRVAVHYIQLFTIISISDVLLEKIGINGIKRWVYSIVIAITILSKIN